MDVCNGIVLACGYLEAKEKEYVKVDVMLVRMKRKDTTGC